MAEALSGVNGNIIRWAREFYNMSAEEAANAIGVELDRYNRFENGLEFPTYARLKKISTVFHKPTAVFFFPEPPVLPEIKGDLRTLSNETVNSFSKNVIVQFEKAKVYQINLQEIYGFRNSIIAQRGLLPRNIEDLCDYFRIQLKMPLSLQKSKKKAKDVFELFREKLYDIGIYVFKDAFKDDRISGVCLNDDSFPVIVINNSMSFTRQIFTLFHELYHLVSNTSGAEIIRDDYYSTLDDNQREIEKSCDSFANAFLVPMDDFEKELEKEELDEKYIEKLSVLYSVSREVIMYKLYMMGRITPEIYNELKETFYGDAIRNNEKNKGNGGNYYNTHLSYLGSRYTGDVFKEYYSGRINAIHASELLQSKVDHLQVLERIYFKEVSR